MEINPSEVTKILKEQIKNFGEKAEISEVGKVLSGLISRITKKFDIKSIDKIEDLDKFKN